MYACAAVRRGLDFLIAVFLRRRICEETAHGFFLLLSLELFSAKFLSSRISALGSELIAVPLADDRVVRFVRSSQGS